MIYLVTWCQWYGDELQKADGRGKGVAVAQELGEVVKLGI